MKRIILLLSGFILLAACRKNNEQLDGDAAIVKKILQTQLSPTDMTAADLSSLQEATLPSGHHIYRLRMKEENIMVETDKENAFLKGSIYHVEGNISKVSGHMKFNGSFNKSDLNRNNVVNWGIENNVVKELHRFNSIVLNGGQPRVNYACADCTLDEVVVSTSYSGSTGISWASWMSLLAMFDMGGQNDYIAIDWTFGGGGGGGGSAPVITIDPNDPQNKDRIDPKKYTDCFGTISDGGTTTYSVTISADLPVDGHPETFFDWSTQNPGHAFIELNKSTPYGGVSQDIGFYPNTSFKVLSGDNTASKVVNDGNHEYQARYTITVTAAQFQSAIDKLNQASSNDYNISHYNCTDFALDVFNAAGGGLTIPRHGVPGFEIDGGSNTPQGLYEKINQLKNNGTAGTTTTNSKEYASSSKGPCN